MALLQFLKGASRQAVTASQPMPVAGPDQALVIDQANGAKASITTNATVITQPAGCYWTRFVSDVAAVITPNGGTAVDGGASLYLPAGIPVTVRVEPETVVKGLSLSGTAVIRAMPLKPPA